MQLKAFNELVQPISNKLYLAALRLVVNREDARDIVQEAVLKLWEKRGELDHIENKEAWAMKIVINKSLDWLKKHKPIYMDLNDDQFKLAGNDDPEKQLQVKEQLNTVHLLVQRMSPDHKTIFELREIQGLSYKEIAEIMDIDINLVKVNLHRIRKKLKEHCESLKNMESPKTKILLEKYWDGRTSLEEEAKMPAIFEGEVPKDDKKYAVIFDYKELLQKEEGEPFDLSFLEEVKTDKAKLQHIANYGPWRKLAFGVAASIMIAIMSVSYQWPRTQTLEAQSIEIENAYYETLATLQLVAEKLNKGSESIHEISAFDAAAKHILYEN